MNGLPLPPCKPLYYAPIFYISRVYVITFLLSKFTKIMPGQHKDRQRYRKPYRDSDILSGTHLSEAQRVEILTLFHRAGWNKTKIAKELQIAHSTVRLTIKRGICTPTKPIGRHVMLTARKRRRLIQYATKDALHRRLCYTEVAFLAGISACRRTLTKAFETKQYYRRKAAEKPLLTPIHMVKRTTFAELHKQWQFDMWKRVEWTDKAMIRIGGFGDIWVTRTAEEKYEPSCLTPKFRQRPGLMIHGSISGISKGPLTIFDPNEKVTAAVYSSKVLPRVHQHIREMERKLGAFRGILMEDNASVHTASLTQSWHAYYGFNKMVWPANSPDLNPIENVWRLLKYRIGKRFPKTNDELRQYIIDEWDKLTVDDYIKYIHEMPSRCKAVRDSNGGHTKW
jgi:transposase